jgi:hypothetical protein
MSVVGSQTVTYRNRHNKMTAALDRIFSGLNPTTEASRAGRCDTVVKDYDAKVSRSVDRGKTRSRQGIDENCNRAAI